MSFLARRLRLRLAQHLVLRLDLFVQVADRSCSTESLAGFFCQASRPGAPSASDRRPWGCKPSSSRSFEMGCVSSRRRLRMATLSIGLPKCKTVGRHSSGLADGGCYRRRLSYVD